MKEEATRFQGVIIAVIVLAILIMLWWCRWLLLLRLPLRVIGFHQLISVRSSGSIRRFSLAEDTAADHDDDDDDEENTTAYGNRSLSWTNKYRKLLPYEYARKSVMALGLRSKEEWDEYLEDGKKYHGPYLPSRPDEMYEDDWISWEEFLGVMRTYEETRRIVQHVLQLKSMDDYSAFIKADTKRAEDLRIPAIPEKVYKDKGWEGFDHFFGTTGEEKKCDC